MPVSYMVNGKRVDAWGEPVKASADSKPADPPFDPATVEDSDLDGLKKDELLAVAAHREIEVNQSATKGEIVAAITAAGANGNSDGSGDNTGNGS